MKRWLLLAMFVLPGCSTCPQADFMDTFFKSRNACGGPTVTTAGDQEPGRKCGCGKKECALCKPFRIFHRNRN